MVGAAFPIALIPTLVLLLELSAPEERRILFLVSWRYGAVALYVVCPWRFDPRPPLHIRLELAEERLRRRADRLARARRRLE